MGRYGWITSGTLGWNTRPKAMPTTSATIPIMKVPSLQLRSRGPNLLGEVEVSSRATRHDDVGALRHGDTNRVGGLEQANALHARTGVERLPHPVRWADG